MSTAVLPVTDTAFDEAVSTGLVLVDFWAPWCGPCRALAPVLDALAEDFTGRVRILKLNTEENPEITARYGVSAVPSMLFFKDGLLAGRLVGSRSRGQLRDFLEAAL